MFRTAYLIVGGPKAKRKSLRRNESSKSGSASDAEESHEDTITNGSKKSNGGGGQILFSTFGSNLQKEKEKFDISDTSPSDSDFGELLEIEPEVDIQEDDSNIVVTNDDIKDSSKESFQN